MTAKIKQTFTANLLFSNMFYSTYFDKKRSIVLYDNEITSLIDIFFYKEVSI